MKTREILARPIVYGLAFFVLLATNYYSVGCVPNGQSEQDPNDEVQLFQTSKLSEELSTIQFELKADTYCELNLHDLDGNRIQSIEAEQKKKGKHLVLWKHSEITSGSYMLTLCTDQGEEHLEVVLE